MEANGKPVSLLLESLPPLDEVILNDTASYPAELDDWMRECAVDGEIPFEWEKVAPLLAMKSIGVLNSYFQKRGFLGPIIQTFEQRKAQILRLLSNRRHFPFTIQRFLEVLLDPDRYYQSTHKLMNAIEKLLLITLPPDKKRRRVMR